jgi:hypothetical protein
MSEGTHRSLDSHLVRIEPDDRLVVLARMIKVSDSEAEAIVIDCAVNWSRFGNKCLGQSLYRHRAVFQNAADAPVWSHVELSYFHDIVPAEVISELVLNQQSRGVHLLRAEILLTTPSSFILPRDWQGSVDRPERQVSLEYIEVQPKHLRRYREVMRDYCGVAAMKLVQEDRFGTFRAMETAVILYRAPEMTIHWNQIHLCELNPNGFEGFGKEFAAALRLDGPKNVDLPDAFADLGGIRTISRWTFNDPVVEADRTVGTVGITERSSGPPSASTEVSP